MNADLKGSRQGVVPYIAAWSEEQVLPMKITAGRTGIAYTDETLIDRDSQGVLWTRRMSRPKVGRPRFAQEHPVRQRRAMRKLLCQVCGGPADRTDEGVLWLLRDHQEDWPGWPDNMANTDPPVCVPCARIAVRLCPALRGGYVAIRAHSVVSGVFGITYRATGRFGAAEMVGKDNVTYDDPAIRWTRAVKLIRVLQDSRLADLNEI